MVAFHRPERQQETAGPHFSNPSKFLGFQGVEEELFALMRQELQGNRNGCSVFFK